MLKKSLFLLSFILLLYCCKTNKKNVSVDNKEAAIERAKSVLLPMTEENLRKYNYSVELSNDTWRVYVFTDDYRQKGGAITIWIDKKDGKILHIRRDK